MQFFQQPINVGKLTGTTDDLGCKVLDRLKFVEISVRCIGPVGRAIKRLTKHKVLIVVVKVDLLNTCLTRLI